MAKVMVVDDAQSDLRLIEAILQSAGHQVVSVRRRHPAGGAAGGRAPGRAPARHRHAQVATATRCSAGHARRTSAPEPTRGRRRQLQEPGERSPVGQAPGRRRIPHQAFHGRTAPQRWSAAARAAHDHEIAETTPTAAADAPSRAACLLFACPERVRGRGATLPRGGGLRGPHAGAAGAPRTCGASRTCVATSCRSSTRVRCSGCRPAARGAAARWSCGRARPQVALVIDAALALESFDQVSSLGEPAQRHARRGGTGRAGAGPGAG